MSYKYYRFENCGAFLAFLKPYFFLSIRLESLVKYPSNFSAVLFSGLTLQSALTNPNRIASVCPVKPPPVAFTYISYLLSKPNVLVYVLNTLLFYFLELVHRYFGKFFS